MASEEIAALRGKQATVGDLVFEFPLSRPESDEEILETEALIADVLHEIAEPEAVAKLGRGVEGWCDGAPDRSRFASVANEVCRIAEEALACATGLPGRSTLDSPSSRGATRFTGTDTDLRDAARGLQGPEGGHR